MEDLQARCIRACPDTSLLPGGFYFAPGFDNGANIFIAAGLNGEYYGHVVVYPYQISRALDGARVLWMDLRVDPHLPGGPLIKDALLLKAIDRAGEIQQKLSEPAVLSVTYFARGAASIEYLQARGFRHYETAYILRRDLSNPIPEFPIPAGVTLLPWKMETVREQEEYIRAYESVLNNDAWDLKGLQHFMSSDFWSVGTTFTAFAGGQIAGSLIAYYGPDDPEKIGTTEHFFVLPQWRQQGLASLLIAEALRFLKSRGLAEAELQVTAENPRAITTYQKLGYEVYQEEVSLGFAI